MKIASFKCCYCDEVFNTGTDFVFQKYNVHGALEMIRKYGVEQESKGSSKKPCINSTDKK